MDYLIVRNDDSYFFVLLTKMEQIPFSRLQGTVLSSYTSTHTHTHIHTHSLEGKMDEKIFQSTNVFAFHYNENDYSPITQI